jgi:hypothetical protein
MHAFKVKVKQVHHHTDSTIAAAAAGAAAAFVRRATQLLPDVRYSDSEYRTTLTLSPNSEYTAAFKVSRHGASLRFASVAVRHYCTTQQP